MAGTPQLVKWVELLLRLGLAGIFIVAGVLKIIDPKSLTTAIETYQLVPYEMAVLMSLFVPWLEVLAGAGLLFKKLYGGSLLILIGLLVLFTIALAQGWIRGLDVTCGCFGGADQINQTNYPVLVGRDLLMLGAAIVLWIRQLKQDSQI